MGKINKILNEETIKMTKADYLIISIIIISYTILSFINLGSVKNPQTFYQFKENEAITFTLTSIDDIIKIKFYNGDINGEYAIYISTDNKLYKYINTFKGNGAFAWNEEKILSRGKHIKIISLVENASIGELALYNNTNESPKIANITSTNNKKVKTLTDEYKIIPKQISYLNSTYFDEIYFARTAYDYKEGKEAYEWVHPPLGKMIQALPVIIFDNMAPFFYRIMGNIAGITMIFIMYLFGKMLFKKRKYAIFASLLMYFDTFHFAHTRMGTIDSFLVMFIMLSVYFMYKYINNKEYKYNLSLSGLFFSLSVCVKWTGLLSGIALAIIYFIDILKNKEHLPKKILQGFIFFVFIPLILYIGVYLLYPNNQVTYTDSIKDIITQTKAMYNYHSRLETQHFFSSEWYTWILSHKPVWYYTQNISTNIRGTITGIGNIVIWWMVPVSLIYLIYKLFRKKDKNAFHILITIFSLWIPYIFIGRVMFLYHYFPVLPFTMLAITMMFNDIEVKTKNNYIMPAYLALVIIFFVIYFPVVSGIPISTTYIEQLKLLPSWHF